MAEVNNSSEYTRRLSLGFSAIALGLSIAALIISIVALGFLMQTKSQGGHDYLTSKAPMQAINKEAKQMALEAPKSSASESRKRALTRLESMRQQDGLIDRSSSSSEKEDNPMSSTTMPSTSTQSSEEVVSQQVSDGKEDDKSMPAKVDLSQLTDRGYYLDYAGSEIIKLGFTDQGARMSPMETQQARANFVQRITGQGDAFTFFYPAKGEEKSKVLVFTDPTCPFCQRLHDDIEHIQAAGISVHYMMFPRRLAHGYGDPVAQQVLSAFEYAWCSSDPVNAMDEVYRNGIERYSASECVAQEQGRANFPYAEHFLMVKMAGVTATPITFTDDGREIVGYSNLSSYLSQLGVR